MRWTKRLFSAGECLVCPGWDSLIVLEVKATGCPVFYCPMCGVAWPHPPELTIRNNPDIVFDEADTPALYEAAPEGVVLPSDACLRRTFAMGIRIQLVKEDCWWPDVEEVLHDPRKPYKCVVRAT